MPRKSTKPPSGVGFAQAQIALTILGNIADGAVVVPGLKFAARTALEIIKIADVGVVCLVHHSISSSH